MNLTSFYKNISKNMKFYRTRLGITQEQLAEKTGLSLDYIGKIEVGTNRPGLVGLYKIISALKVPVRVFFENFED